MFNTTSVNDVRNTLNLFRRSTSRADNFWPRFSFSSDLICFTRLMVWFQHILTRPGLSARSAVGPLVQQSVHQSINLSLRALLGLGQLVRPLHT